MSDYSSHTAKICTVQKLPDFHGILNRFKQPNWTKKSKKVFTETRILTTCNFTRCQTTGLYTRNYVLEGVQKSPGDTLRDLYVPPRGGGFPRGTEEAAHPRVWLATPGCPHPLAARCRTAPACTAPSSRQGAQAAAPPAAGGTPWHGHPPPGPATAPLFLWDTVRDGNSCSEGKPFLVYLQAHKSSQKHTEPRFTNCSLSGLLMISNWRFRRCSWCLHSLLRGLACWIMFVLLYLPT